ncbi:MAG: Rap1a/Tai family immunity protein [Desulfopila sp.]
MTFYHLVCTGAVCIALVMLTPLQADAQRARSGLPLFPASALRDALEGESFGHRGMLRSGQEATAFAEGYIAALSDIGEERGTWCGAPHILVHEVTAQVYDYLVEMGEAAKFTPAAEAGLAALNALWPCKAD